MVKNLTLCVLLCLGVMVSVLVGCTTPAEETAVPPPATKEIAPTSTSIPPTPEPVILVYGNSTEPDVGMTPVFGGNYATYVAFDLVFNKLVRLDDQLQPIPDLAASWELSADNLVWTFHLVEDVKWHDGTPFTAEDVKFTYETMKDPDVNSPFASNLDQVSDIEVVDDLTLKVTLDATYAPFLVKLADMSIMPKHLLENVADYQTTEFQRNPVGTGPFALVEWQTGAFLRFTANPDYFRGKPAIDELVFKIVPDADVLSVQLETGEVDVVEGVSPAVAGRTEDNPDVDLVRYTAMRLRYLQLSQLNPLLQDKRVRQAIAYALDRQGIIDTILEGYGERCRTDYPPSSWVYNPNARIYDYDVPAAQALLADAGWEMGSDGVLVKDGERLEFDILVKAGDIQT